MAFCNKHTNSRSVSYSISITPIHRRHKIKDSNNKFIWKTSIIGVHNNKQNLFINQFGIYCMYSICLLLPFRFRVHRIILTKYYGYLIGKYVCFLSKVTFVSLSQNCAKSIRLVCFYTRKLIFHCLYFH